MTLGIEGEVDELECEIRRLTRDLEQKNNRLQALRRSCNHKWNDANGIYNPIVQEGYVSLGDTPGTMGVDYRGPVVVPRETKPRWTRRCLICGHVEHTERSVEAIVQKASW